MLHLELDWFHPRVTVFTDYIQLQFSMDTSTSIKQAGLLLVKILRLIILGPIKRQESSH